MNKVVKRTLKPWKTYEFGGIAGKEFLHKTIKIHLVILTPHELGNPRYVDQTLCKWWSTEHLEGQIIELCQPEDGRYLRRKLEHEQLSKGMFWMAIERPCDSDYSHGAFYVLRYDRGRGWVSDYWTSGGIWYHNNHIVCRLCNL